MSRIVAVFNHKGGVGKTTTVANLGAALADGGRRVLLVDIDPQACLTVHLGLDPAEATPSIYDVLTGEAPLREAIHPAGQDRLAVIPSHLDLAGAEMELASTIGRETILQAAIRNAGLDEWDTILIDCPPSLGLLTVNALCACAEVFVPIQTEFLAMRGMSKLLEVVELVQRRLNPKIRISAIIPTMYRTGTLLAREVKEELENCFGARVLRNVVRTNVRLAEAPSHGKTIFAYAPNSPGAADYRALAAEVESLWAPSGAAETGRASAAAPQAPAVDPGEPATNGAGPTAAPIPEERGEGSTTPAEERA